MYEYVIYQLEEQGTLLNLILILVCITYLPCKTVSNTVQVYTYLLYEYEYEYEYEYCTVCVV